MIFGSDISKLSDGEILAAYRRDNSNAWVGELYRRYSHLVFGVCLKYLKDKDDAGDATIALFEKLMSDLKTREVDLFQNWLYIVTKNHCLMILRAKSSEIEKLNGYRHEQKTNDHSEPGEVSYEELKEIGLNKLTDAITRLGGHQRECVRLFYLEEKSYRDISLETGYSTNEVKSHIQNGKRNLKILLTGQS